MLRRPALGECGNVFGEPIHVDDIGAEVVWEPFFELAAALMFGVGDGFEELGIAPVAPMSKGGSGSCSIKRG